MTTDKLFIVDLGLIALSEADKPTRIPIAITGTYYKGKQRFSITKADVATMAENFGKRGADVVIDYDHASNNPEVALGGPIPAAGWIKSIDAQPDADGIVWGEAVFTSKARDMIAASEYKYLSPVLNYGARDKSTGKPQGLTIPSVALTNTPVLDRMPAIRLSETGWTKDEGDGQGMGKKDEAVMCSEHPKTKMLCPECDGDEIKSMVAASEAANGPKVITLSEIGRDDKGRLNLSKLGNDAVLSISAVRAIEAERVALSEVDAAVSKGKISPAQRGHFEKVALSDIGTFRGILETLPSQVDLSEHGMGGDGGEMNDLAKIDALLDQKARERMTNGVSYHEALKIVASENPELNRRRTQLMRRAIGGDED